MIQARHVAWADRIFHPDVRWLFKRHFHAIRLHGKTPETNLELPLPLLPNHRTWWDGFFVYLLNKELFKRKPYLMMLEAQLSRYRHFARLGAYSINSQSPGGDFTAPAPAALFTPAAADGGDGWKLDGGLRFVRGTGGDEIGLLELTPRYGAITQLSRLDCLWLHPFVYWLAIGMIARKRAGVGSSCVYRTTLLFCIGQFILIRTRGGS